VSALRWAVVGCGDFGLRHLAALRSLGQDVAAVVEVDPGRRRRAVEVAGPAIATDDLDEALASRPDVVIVATPEQLHLEPAIRSLAVADVLVEKPLAATADDADAIAAAADASGRRLFVGHLLRFDPRLVALRSLVDAGRLGDVVHVACRRIGLRSLAATYQRVEPLVLSGVHDADVVSWMTGRRAIRVDAVASRRLGLATAEYQVAMLDLGDGASAVIEAGWLLPAGAAQTPHVAIEVIGTDATARIVDDTALTLLDADGVHEIEAGDPSSWEPASMLRAQCEHVIAHVRSRQPSTLIGPDVAVAALRTMLAAARAAASGQPVEVTW